MGRQRNLQMKEKEGSPEKELKMETSNLSDKEFTVTVMRLFKQLSEKSKQLN